MAWWSALTGAASGGGGGGIASLSPSGRAMKFIKDRDARRDATEFANQTRTEGLFNYDRAMDAYERGQDLAPKLTGQVNADYDNAGFHVATDRDQIGGGALKTQLEQSQGYNPTMAYNPYLNIFDADKTAVQALKSNAEQQAEATLSGWEDAQEKTAGDLEDSFAEIRDDRDQMRTDYTSAIEEGREEERLDTAQHIVESWILSSDRHGAEGGPGVGDDFLKRTGRGTRRLGAGVATVLGAPGLFSGSRGGRVQGASGSQKREYIEERLAGGESYADILNDQDFIDTYLSKDDTAGPLYGSRWEG